MKKLNLVRTIILAGSLLLQLNTLCFQSRGAAGDVDLSFDPGSGVNGTVNAVAVQPDGKVIIGGEFTTVKGLARPGLARLNADGSGDSSFNPGALPGGFISIGLQSDGKVLVGNYSGILRLNADGSLDTIFSASITSFDDYDGVYAIAIQADGKVVIGGIFSVMNGANRNGIARLNANGSLDTSFNPGTGANEVYSIVVQSDGRVLIGGNFLSVNGTNRNNIARLNANGSLDSSFNPGTGANDYVPSIALQPDGRVFIGGGFSTVNGTNRNGIARLNANGSLDDSFNPDTGVGGYSYYFPNVVSSVVVQPDGRVLIGGGFSTVNGTNRNGIARLNANGSLDSSFNPGTGANDYVSSIALQPDGRVLISGQYMTVNNDSITRLNADGSLDSSFNSGKEISGDVSPRVSSVVVQSDGKVLISGWFNSVSGTNRNRIARLNANGSLDSTFDPGTGANSTVNSLALQSDGKVLIGGSFSSVNGTNHNSIARLNANGSLDNNFQPDLAALDQSNDCPPGYNCDTYTETTAILVQPDGKVFIGGNFWTIVWGHQEGEESYYLSRYFLARFNANGSLDSSFNPGTNVSASAIALQPDGKVIFGGGLILNGTNYTIARLNADGSLDGSFNPDTGANGVSSIALQSDGKVLIVGSFNTVNGTNRNLVARLNANGSLDNTFNPGAGTSIPGSSVYSVASQPDGKVLIGGFMFHLNGTNCNGIARVNANGSPDSSFNPGTGASSLIPGTGINGVVYSVGLQPDGKVLIGGAFTTVNGVVRPFIARLYGDSAPSLNIARSNAFVIVSWPVTGLNFQLQESTNLSLPNSWSPVAQPAVTNAGQISMTVPTTVGRKFFRLKSQ
jgi:uncharacterized delta-60 repeat protein